VESRYVWYGFLGIGTYLGLITAKQKYLDGMYRVIGPFDHSNTIPAYVNLIMPTLFIWGLSDRSFRLRETVLSLFISLGLVFAVFATQSRAGLVLSTGLLLGMLTLAGIRIQTGRVYLTGIVIMILMIGGGIKASDTIINRFLNAPKTSEEARNEFNVAARKMAVDHVFGVGLNNFSKVLTENERYNSHIRVMASEKQSGVVHHFYLLTAAEMGMPALLIFLLIIFRFTIMFLRMGWKNRSTGGMLLLGLAAGAIALHLTGFLEWVLRITPVSYQFVITSGFGVALVHNLKNDSKENEPSLQP
jgi:O-Antigen ligase